jgi:predicted dinucleotide-binding enzyme
MNKLANKVAVMYGTGAIGSTLAKAFTKEKQNTYKKININQ